MQFDVFISYRRTDGGGDPSRDSVLARRIHDFLKARGVRPFMADVTLQGMGQAEYRRGIDEALDGVPILVVVATSLANIESNWVRYEWDSYHNDILTKGKQGVLLSYLDGVEPVSLPRPLRLYQAIQNSEGALEILFSYVSATLGFRHVEELTRSGESAVARLNMLTEVMAESRLLELEITAGNFGAIFTPEQRARMQNQMARLRIILNAGQGEQDARELPQSQQRRE